MQPPQPVGMLTSPEFLSRISLEAYSLGNPLLWDGTKSILMLGSVNKVTPQVPALSKIITALLERSFVEDSFYA